MLLAALAVGAAVPLAEGLDNGFTAPPMGWSALYGAPFNQVNQTIDTRFFLPPLFPTYMKSVILLR